MNTLQLLPDAADDAVVAYRDGRSVVRTEFLAEIGAVAARLPDCRYALNLCQDRYWFAVGLFASIARGIVSLLPHSAASEHLLALRAEYPDSVCVTDDARSPLPNSPCLRIDHANSAPRTGNPVPRIPFDQRIARVFTSGSTGQPQPHDKTFGRFCQSIHAEAELLWGVSKAPCAVLGTVPFRHMFGLESSVFLPLLGGGAIASRTPYYPADIADALGQLPPPRLLVTTPFHLRKLVDAEIDIPGVSAILSATAPMPLDLATLVEEKLRAPLMEIYGSTETGQLAMRRPAQERKWHLYPGIALGQQDGFATVVGGHLEQVQALNDVVEPLDATTFHLLDRHANLVNIVGKRSSLAFLNHLICSLPGVQDGVFCMPEEDSGTEVKRLAAFVVAPGLSAADILSALRPHLDPVFLPRRIVHVDALPRDGNGKLPSAALKALITRYLPGRG